MTTVTVATASPSLIDLARDFYQDEIKDHDTYNALAERERNPELRAVLRRIAGIELKHSTFWHAVLERRNAAVPQARTGRARLVVLRTLQRFVSSPFLVSALEAGESGAFAKYLECLRHADLSEPERDQLRAIVLDEIEHEMTFRRESSKLGLSNVRDYVLGMNDGLVEILGVVTGLSAVYAGNPLVVGLSGVVVGIAGAMSMGIGAFVSVRSQRQVNEALRERVEILFQVAPQRAVSEYQDRLAESGVPDATAAEVAQRVGANREAISRLLLPESTENELRSGLFTGLAYLVGVVFPVLPYFVAGSSFTALIGSLALAGIALALTATMVSVLSGISLRKKVTEMIIAAFSAAAIAYLFGWMLRAATGIQL
ncbi:MAG: VIT1/CCC1 transporter family protein [Gammaproteobacteria bacterium]